MNNSYNFETMSADGLRDFVKNNFHKISHTQSFGQLLNRLEKIEGELTEAKTELERCRKIIVAKDKINLGYSKGDRILINSGILDLEMLQ